MASRFFNKHCLKNPAGYNPIVDSIGLLLQGDSRFALYCCRAKNYEIEAYYEKVHHKVL